MRANYKFATEKTKWAGDGDGSDGSSPPRRKAKVDYTAVAAGPVPTHELKYGTTLYHCGHWDMFALLKQKLAAHKREMHNKKPPKKKVNSRSRKHTTSTRYQESTINKGAAASEGDQGAKASGSGQGAAASDSEGDQGAKASGSGQGAAPESGQLGATSEGEAEKVDNVELTCDSEDSMEYDLTDDLTDDDRSRRLESSDEDDDEPIPHDELHGPVF